MSTNVETVVNEASASSNNVNDHCRHVLDSACASLVNQALTSQFSGRSSKKSSTLSKRSKMLLKLQGEEIERPADARKAILEAELRVKQLEIACLLLVLTLLRRGRSVPLEVWSMSSLVL